MSPRGHFILKKNNVSLWSHNIYKITYYEARTYVKSVPEKPQHSQNNVSLRSHRIYKITYYEDRIFVTKKKVSLRSNDIYKIQSP
jgi:hypothetical protein